ncbi:hypothetical protein RHMOL_Rhmol09G0188900 [Rhododendron molle]|uniref:Uncharacterized protein n=1 Tax=Rhododendron molle TaxID=49168 RepID=A0ACC0MEX0_RHOML|nr:hypothetical protein RHMOL_Rhmol09G0188900 [Rhododendron molle]
MARCLSSCVPTVWDPVDLPFLEGFCWVVHRGSAGVRWWWRLLARGGSRWLCQCGSSCLPASGLVWYIQGWAWPVFD